MKAITIFLFVFSISVLNAQDTQKPVFGVDYKIRSLSYGGDMLSGLDSIVIHAEFDSVSGIIPLCSSAKRSYGIQFEVITSHGAIDNKVFYFVRTAYYYKENDRWILIAVNPPNARGLSTGSSKALDIDRAKKTDNDYKSGLKVVYTDHCYLN